MTSSDSWGSDADLLKVAELLREVFPHPERFTLDRLTWSYRDHPLGVTPVGRKFTDDGQQVGNYALIPIRLTNGSQSLMLGLGVDLAVSPSARGSGTFRETVYRSYEEAQRLNFDGILGIANAQSAPRMVKAMGWRHLPSMATKLLLPLSIGRGQSHRHAHDSLTDADVRGAIARIDTGARGGWHQEWDETLIAWRLAMPGASYSLHLLDDCVAISTTDKIAGLPVAVLLKVLPLRETSSANGRRIAARLMRAHHTPLVVYWGRNSRLSAPGIRLPKRLQPSPLEVVLHLFTRETAVVVDAAGDFVLDDFELLDLDAY